MFNNGIQYRIYGHINHTSTAKAVLSWTKLVGYLYETTFVYLHTVAHRAFLVQKEYPVVVFKLNSLYAAILNYLKRWSYLITSITIY